MNPSQITRQILMDVIADNGHASDEAQDIYQKHFTPADITVIEECVGRCLNEGMIFDDYNLGLLSAGEHDETAEFCAKFKSGPELNNAIEICVCRSYL